MPASAIIGLTPGTSKVIAWSLRGLSQGKQESKTTPRRWAERRWKGKRTAQTRLRYDCNTFSLKVASSGIAGSGDFSKVITQLLQWVLQFGALSALSCMHYLKKLAGISSEVSTHSVVTPCTTLSHKNGKYLQLLPGMRKIAFPSSLWSGHCWKLEEAGSFNFETSLYKGKRVLGIWLENNNRLCFNNILIICNITNLASKMHHKLLSCSTWDKH